VTEFGTTTPGAVMLRLLVVGVPVASPGRTDTQPIVVGDTTVTLAVIPAAPAGTGSAVPMPPVGRITGIVPVTRNVSAWPLTSGLGRPNATRVSSARIGAIGTNAAGVAAARTTAIPPAPKLTATAAPIAAQRARHTRGADLFAVVFVMLSFSSSGWSAGCWRWSLGRLPTRSPVLY